MINKILGRLPSVRSFVFAIAALATLAVQAFDTPYLTFRSATSFTLSATKAWDGTLQKATSNPADGSSWSDWTGSSITAVQSDGQYYIYLRGTGNTVVNNSYTAWTLTGSNIYCEGDIETLRGYDGNAPTMAESCYKCMFKGCTALKSIPTFSETTVPNTAYYQMFQNCTGLEINTSGPGDEWAFPDGTTGTSIWNYSMFEGTSGSFTGNPVAGTTYYVASALPPGEMYQVGGSGALDLALVGYSYSRDLTSTIKNGTTPYAFTLASGTLPLGLSISGSTLSGTPTTAGNYAFTLSVQDAESHVLSSASYTLKVVQPTVVNTAYVAADGSGANADCIRLTTDVTTLNQEWYVVDGTLNFGVGGIKVSGNVNLVLADGASLTVQGAANKAGINVAPGNSLAIYGQTEGTGVLTASDYASESNINNGGAGIGGNYKESCGTVTINGCTITATSRYAGAGIGGGANGNGGTVVINGGTIVATGGSWYGAGIGGGYNGNGANVTIMGGTVTASGGSSSAGSGYGCNGIGKGYGSASSYNVGTLIVGSTVSVKAGATSNPQTDITPSGGGSVTIGYQRYFKTENVGLLQTASEFAAYTGESKSWNLSDTITGGASPYTFTPVAGFEPPSGLTLVGTTLSGAVAAANTYTFKYTVTDSSATPLNLEAVYTLTVSVPDPLAAQTNLGKAKVGKSKNVNLSSTVSGGVPPYAFAFSGSHSSAFSLDGNVLTILADSANTYTCGITVTDSLNTQLNATYSIEVVEPAGFIDDDPEEPESGDTVTVDCLTPDGVYPRTCHLVTSATTNVTWANSWYYVTGNVTLTKGVTVSGKVSLILGDNATLTVSQSDVYSYKAGINVTGDNSLVIYAQSSGANVGRLMATAANYAAGIGGDQYQSCGKVSIVSGSITASSLSSTYYGAGIGGGQNGNGGTVTIYGGTVVAQCPGSSAGGAGIGSGGSSSSTDATHGGTLTVYGGTVTASASNYGAAIGGGKYGSGGTVTICGGTVTSTTTATGAGIGGGWNGNGGTVVISNGTVTATSGQYGAGIGGGQNGSGGTLSVYGGTVTATAGQYGGTGVGKGSSGSSNGELTVGADVDVTAGTNADTAVPLDPVVIGTQRYFHFAAYVPTPIVQAKSALYAYAGEAMSLSLSDTISGGRKPYTFTGTLPQGLTIDGGATLAGTLAAGTYNFTLTVTDVKGVSESFGYTLTVVERTGFIDDDPDEPADGVMVSCRTASGDIGLRTCNQVTSSPSTAVTWSDSWYYVSGNVTLGKGVTVSGKVSLILGDDATLTINGSVFNAGINVADGNSLVIYGQEGGTGALTATGGSSGAGIGGNSSESCGKVVICGGVVTAQSSEQGAGIGGGFSGTCGTIIVNGGTVNATGSSNGAGIGGGSSASQGGTVTINGGTVNATGGRYGAGVGGGNSGAGGNVIINGGYLTATGGSSGAGIGGGNSGSGGAVKINGGTVRASTSSAYTHNSAPKGIGKGSNGTSNGTLTVEPGTTVQVGFDPTSTLTTLTAVNKEITLGNYRYFEIDGPRPLTQAETTLTPVYTGANSSWTLSDTIDGGIPTYTFALKSGSSLPDGLSLLSGVLTGRPSAANTYTFTLVVTDSASNSIDAEYTLVVTDPPEMTVALPDLGNATKGINKSYTLSTKVSGGVTPYTSFAVTSGSVPPGLSLSNAGVLSGTPTTPGNYSFTITIRDSALPSNSCDAEFTLSVKEVYNISYYDGETKLSPSSSYTTYVEGEFKALSYAPTKSGYLFVGWNDADGNRVIRIEDTDTGDKTFYAEWEERVAEKSMTFIDADGSERTETCTVIYSDTGTTLASGWYVARGSVSFTGGLTVNGTTASPVHLVLEDGCSLTVSQSVNNNAGISVATGKSLVIYGQSKNTGTLNVTGGNYGAAIGGGRGAACGTVTINGGTVNAGGMASSNRGAGIGGGYDSSGAGGNGGTVTINGGNVTASSSQSAGIGGGRGGQSGTYSYTYYKSGDGGTVTINGGNVTAIGGGVCAGIGGAGTTFGTSYAGSGGTVTITGGNVTATGNNRGAGIGGGLYGSGGNVTITGGRVVATGGEQSNTYFGAGIGAGYGGESQGSLTVNDVIVKAGDSENPETELTPTAGEIALGGDRYYVVASASAATVSDITYKSGDTTLSGVSPANYTEGVGADLSTAVPIKTGYTFCGWYDNADLTGDEVTAISAESTGPVTLWAKWEPTVFTITYIGQDGITPITDLTPTNYTILSDTITLPAPPAPEGKMFDGWYTQYDFSTPDVSVIAAGSSGNKTYYAKWATVSKVPVEFVGADGLPQTEQCRPLALGVTELRNGGWYVVNSALNYGANGLTVHGVVNLVLADGASLVVTGSTQQAGITVTHGNALNIYAQSLGTGTINASGATSGAGIGGNSHADCGTVTIYGGVINATGRGGAGIGGGESGNGGNVTINGGTVNANGFTSGAGIGGGHSGDGGNVTINGGTVTAIGGMSGGAGIGGGDKGISANKGNGGIVRINGGTVVAIGGETEGYGFGAGIGAGRGATDQGSLFVGESMTAFAGNSADPTVAPARDATTGEVTLGGEQYYTVAPTSASTSFSITYMNGEQVLSLSPDTYASGDGATLPTAQDMVRSGATFGGWYESADFSGSAVTAIEPGSTGEKTFYAKWNVEYVAMDGTTQTHGCTEVTSATTGLAGGWYVVTGSVAFDSTLEVSGTTHLVLASGASLSASAELLSGKSGVEIASGETLTVYGQPDGSGTFQAGAHGANPAFGGTLVIAARMVAKGGQYILTRDPSTGIVSMTLYGNPATTVTLSSILSAITYVDTVTWNDMTGLTPTNYYEGTGATLPTAEQVAKSGYTFEGWYVASDCSGLPVLAVSATDTGDITYYAKFDSTDPDFTIVDGKLTRINPKGHHEVTIPEGVREIGSRVLSYIDDNNNIAYYDVTNVTISSTVTNISEFAFAQSHLTSIVIPGNVKVVDPYAFDGCTNLLEVTIEDGVEHVGESAFVYCTALTTVSIPGSVDTLRDRTFYGCTSLQNVTMASGVKTIGGWVFGDCTSLTDISFPEGLDGIGYCAFYQCTGLVNVVIPKGVAILDSAFYRCTGLKSVNISGTVVSTKKRLLAASGRRLLAAAEPDPEATTVGNYAFYGCSELESALIGSKVSEIGGGTFADCPKLKSITVEAGNEHYATVDGMLLTADGKVLISGAGDATDITVPNGVTNILEGAFAGFTAITNVTLPNTVQVVGEAAFSNATALASMTIPNSVTTIGTRAFYDTALAMVYVAKGDTARVKLLVEGTGYAGTVAYVEPSEEPSAAPSIEGDSGATVTGDETSGYTITPSTTAGTVEVTIPSGLAPEKVTVEVPPTATVKPNGANVAVVKTVETTPYDITEFLDIPAPNASGVVDLSQATVKEAIVKEALDPTKEGVDIDLADTDEPSITTAATKPGLVYTLIEGTSLDNMAPGVGEGKVKIGDGTSWTPTISVKGGTSGFYSIQVTK